MGSFDFGHHNILIHEVKKEEGKRRKLFEQGFFKRRKRKNVADGGRKLKAPRGLKKYGGAPKSTNITDT